LAPAPCAFLKRIVVSVDHDSMNERSSPRGHAARVTGALLPNDRTSGSPAPVADGSDRGRALPKVVITHDFMESWGGAERVTEEMAKAFPEAQVVAILGRPEIARRMGVEGRFRSILPARRRLLDHYRELTPIYGPLTDRFRLPDAEVVLSSSYAFAHRLRSSNGAGYVCYCHTPLRLAWSMTDFYRRVWAGGAVKRPVFELLAPGIRRGDRRAALRIDRYLTQSPFTAEQIERFYGQPAKVIGAPIDCDYFRPSGKPSGDYFLFCGRLIEPFKRVGLTVEVFRRLGWRLVVAGDGPALHELRSAAPPNVEFLGHVDDDTLVELMQGCRAAVFPSRDDFGLIPLEVMACGRPVLAYAGGGPLHTSLPGVTGELFAEHTVESLETALRSFEPERYETARIRDHAMKWDSRRFRDRLVQEVIQVADSTAH
jgi:glycosyltransferase involved in cell wall biosynthesis